MDELKHDGVPSEVPPRTRTVLVVLAGIAMLFSWLGAYALPNALIAADVIQPLAPGHDPRPRWFLIGFAILLMLSVGIGSILRYLSHRQLRRIDAMVEE